MKDKILFMLISACSFLSTCDLEDDDNLRHLYYKLCNIQSFILQYAVEKGFKKVNVFDEIQKDLGNKK